MTIGQQFVRLGKNTLIYGIGSGLNRLISFLLLPLFTQYLTPADYGTSAILGWIVFLVTPIFSLGFGSAITPSYFEGNNLTRKGATIWTAFAILSVSVSVLALLGIVFARSISSVVLQCPAHHYLVKISLVGACLSILGTPFILYLQFEERAKLFVVLTALATLASTGFNLLMVVVLGRGLQGMVEGTAVGQAVTLILFLLPAARLRFRFDLPTARELVRLGVPLVPSFAFLFILQHGNKYVLGWLTGLESVGIYTIGLNFGMMLNLLVGAFTSAWTPFFMSFVERQDEAQSLFGRVLTYYIFGFGLLSLLFYTFAKPLVMLMTQPTFHEAYRVVGLCASAQFLIGIYSILLPGMYFAKEIRYQSLIQLVAAAIGVLLNFLLIPLFGSSGAAVALMLGFFAMVVCTYVWNSRRRHTYIYVRYEWGRIGQFALVYVSYVMLVLWKRNFSWAGEVIFSVLTIMPLLVAVYSLLNLDERHTLWALPKKLLFGLLNTEMI